jgi:hypothetical protein
MPLSVGRRRRRQSLLLLARGEHCTFDFQHPFILPRARALAFDRRASAGCDMVKLD